MTLQSESDHRNKYGHYERGPIAALVPPSARRLLDVGCNTGGFGEGLKKKRTLEVWGVESNVWAANEASKRLDKVFSERFDSSLPLPDRYFDVVVFNDVLEHFEDPWAALALAHGKLVSDGCVVATIPNFLFRDNLLHVLKEKDFRYEEVGIRDRTHLRFFTRKSAQRLFEESGFRVNVVTGLNEQWWSPSLVNRVAYRLLGRQLEETKFLQWVFVATPVEPV